ncbi:hypothetical protein [Rhodanobacter sp. PCA2]|uniref:hypothetical protein n=1 Tax=Rhodanobacter sp. PCA2 TaxID=2006117 RepID=UPI0015E62D54|nr:hypothetical protein [Rhodanobacter sp. PCA2]
MLVEKERTVAFYDLKLILGHHVAADDPSLLGRLLLQIERLAKRYQAIHTEGTSGSNRLSIREVRIEQDFAVLLVSSSDKSISNPVFENQDTGSLRVAEKKPPEGVGTASHVVIYTKTQRKVGTRRKGYLCAIECVDGVGKGRIQRLLDEVLKRALVSYSVGEEHKTEAAKVDFRAHAASSLKDQLANGGALDEILLVREALQDGGIDPPEGVQLVENAVRLKVAPNTNKEKVQSFVRGLFGKSDMDFEYIKVRYHTANGKRTLNIRSEDRANFLEQLMAENTDVRINKVMQQCHEHIVDELVDGIKEEVLRRID